MSETGTGFIYIMSHSSFLPECVNIGYTTDISQRQNELKRITGMENNFEVYATYQVDAKLTNKQLQDCLQKLNPESYSKMISIRGDKGEIIAFYPIQAEEAYAILEAIAVISNQRNRLQKRQNITPVKLARNKRRKKSHKKQGPINLEKCGIMPGEQLEFYDEKSGINFKLIVADSRHVWYDSKVTSLSAVSQEVLQKPSLQGPMYFKYKGEPLLEIRKRLKV